jgi:DNA-binding CsgD family transcriptional regulator
VGGREVEHDMLMEVVGGEEAAMARDLRELVEVGQLVPTRALDDDDAYSFRHALLQEAVYETLLPTERRRLHGRWAEVLGAHGPTPAGADQLVNLAHHWREARDPRALEASTKAGDAAMAGYAYAIAIDEYEEALLAWGPDRDVVAGVDHVELLERAARAAYLATRYRRAEACCREALAELGDGDAARRSMLHILHGRVLWVSGDHAASIEAYEEGVRIAPPEEPLVRARAVAGLGQVYMLGARLREARPLCEEAIAAARASGARDIEGHGLNTLGVVLSGLGETEAAVEAIAAALDIALELGIPDDIGRAYVNRAEIEAWSGYPDQAVATTSEGIRVASEWGVSSIYGAFIGFGGVSFAFETGDWDQAVAMAAEAQRITGDPEGVFVYASSYMLELLACRGDPGFEDLWQRVRRRTAGLPASDNSVAIIQGGIWWALFAGRFDEAVRLLDEGLAIVASTDDGLRAGELARLGAWAVAERGRRASRSGDADGWREAAERMDTLAELTAEAGRAFGDPGARLLRMVELDGAQVAAERTRMKGRSDAAAWASAAAGWAAVGRPFRCALARWREAEAAEASGDRQAAAVALREAHAIAARLGAAPLLGELEALARRLRVRLGAGARSVTLGAGRAYGLTAREREVLDALAAGRTNRQIAEALFISESTAGVHVSNILGKLGVATRTEAARVAIDQGLLERRDRAPEA